MGRPAIYPVQEFNGVIYYRKVEGYYKADFTTYGVTRYMHRDVWEFYNGPIPEGMVVHHKDEDKAHNKIENFELKTNEEHSREHTKARMDADPELKKRFQEAGWEAAKAWHASEEGLAWHSEHGKKSWEGRARETLICTYCGEEYEGIASLKRKGFCSPSCQNMARIKSGVDDEERTCSICSATFKANRYAKKITCSKDCWREGIRRSWAAKRLQS